jgi:predicted nucleic acid-binding protein
LIVLDSSAALDYLLETEKLGEWVAGRLDAAGWILRATYAIDVEVFAVLRALVLKGELSERRAHTLLQVFTGLPIRRYPSLQLFERMWELRQHVPTRDASFVALAEALNVPLVTTDLRLARTHGIHTTIVSP